MRVFRYCLATCFLIVSAPAQQVQLSVADQISAERLLAHIRILASDEFEGRGPGSRGEEKTVEYLITQFREAKLMPVNTDGTYIQRVPLTILSSHGSIHFHGTNGDYSLTQGEVLVCTLPVSLHMEVKEI